MRPVFQITVDEPGKPKATDISAFVKERLVSMKVTDKDGMKADELTIKLAYGPDENGRSLALPPSNRKLDLYLGYDGGKLTPVGSFTIDRFIMTGPPDALEIHAIPADWKSAFKAPRDRNWPDTTLGDVVDTIAAAHGMEAQVSESLRPLRVYILTQIAESDMGLLTRIARSMGAIFKVKAGKIMFVTKGEGKSAKGRLISNTVTFTDVVGWGYRVSDRKNYVAAEAVWRDLDAAVDVVERAGAQTVEPGERVYRIRQMQPNADIAMRTAEAKFQELGRGKGRLILTLPGNPAFFAETELLLEGFHLGIPTRWIVKTVTHTIDGKGFQTRVEAEPPKK